MLLVLYCGIFNVIGIYFQSFGAFVNKVYAIIFCLFEAHMYQGFAGYLGNFKPTLLGPEGTPVYFPETKFLAVSTQNVDLQLFLSKLFILVNFFYLLHVIKSICFSHRAGRCFR